jgi:hypothetical protein
MEAIHRGAWYPQPLLAEALVLLITVHPPAATVVLVAAMDTT